MDRDAFTSRMYALGYTTDEVRGFLDTVAANDLAEVVLCREYPRTSTDFRVARDERCSRVARAQADARAAARDKNAAWSIVNPWARIRALNAASDAYATARSALFHAQIYMQPGDHAYIDCTG